MSKEFNLDTEVYLHCKNCGIEETAKLQDFPKTPKGRFLLPISAQCIKCLGMIVCEIKENG